MERYEIKQLFINLTEELSEKMEYWEDQNSTSHVTWHKKEYENESWDIKNISINSFNRHWIQTCETYEEKAGHNDLSKIKVSDNLAKATNLGI